LQQIRKQAKLSSTKIKRLRRTVVVFYFFLFFLIFLDEYFRSKVKF
jgi:hypothetical protein